MDPIRLLTLPFANKVEPPKGSVLFIFGVSPKPTASDWVKIVSEVSLDGFDAYGFNYRNQTKFTYDFSQCIQDVKEAMEQSQQRTNKPLSVITFGTGAHIAVATISQYRLFPHSVVLVGPSIWPYLPYPDKPLITDSVMFRNAVRSYRSWTGSSAFRYAKTLQGVNTVIIQYSEDPKRHLQIVRRYARTILGSKLMDFPGSRAGILGSPTRLSLLFKTITPHLLG